MENVKLKETLEAIRSGDMILGKSEAFQKVLKTAENYARTDFPVLITGESGTGKELLAKEIHRLSSRRAKPFLTQNCSAIPDTLLESELFGYEKGAFTGATRDRIGLFEAANGGSLFLDEIGDMPIHLQARMLRFLQSGEVKPLGSTRTRKVDVRIISATNKDLKGAIKKELFREDLFYRLNVLPVHLPSLRERREDIPLLLDHFLKREALKLEIPPKRLSEEALRYAVNHPWRGNIRELENFAKHISVVVGGEVIRPNDLSIHLVADQDQLPSGAATGPGERDAGGEAALSATSLFEGRSWDEIEKAYALYLLEKHLWHISRAAKEAGVNRSTFDSRLRRLGISRARTGPGSGQAFSTK